MQSSNHKSNLFKKSRKFQLKKWHIAILITFAVIIGAVASSLIWYSVQLAPVDINDGQPIKMTIVSGSTPKTIAADLESGNIIKSAMAFNLYIRLSGDLNKLQAGTYHFSKSESTQQIVKKLVNGSVNTFSITFYPGATLSDNTKKAESAKLDVTTILLKAGYSKAEVEAALAADYSGPVFAGRPEGASLEGYVYGETYQFNEGASADEILQRSFDELYAQVQQNDLVSKFAAHGLDLYQGITLASIVQREVSNPDDQRQVARVFYNRLSQGMLLGSDVTYQYAADQLGVERDYNLDSPYNTRRYPGLPPGPISAPGLTALLAVADPAENDYLFFLSGDDEVVYYASTGAEHEANIVNHCLVKCATP